MLHFHKVTRIFVSIYRENFFSTILKQKILHNLLTVITNTQEMLFPLCDKLISSMLVFVLGNTGIQSHSFCLTAPNLF